MKKVVITGVSGFLGREVAAAFESRGWSVVELGRRPSQQGREYLQWSLAEQSDRNLKSLAAGALIHCAYDFSLTQWTDLERVNVQGSQRLIESAVQAGISRIILVSTISAFSGCRSLYGKAKLAAESATLQKGGQVIRPGLIWGSSLPGGMFQKLREAAAKSSFVPIIGDGHYPQYLIHQEDLCNALLGMAEAQFTATQPLTLAHPKPWPLIELVRFMATQAGNSVHTIKVPWRLLWMAAKAGETLRLPLPFRSDSIVSLVYQDRCPDFASMQEHGLTVRPFG